MLIDVHGHITSPLLFERQARRRSLRAYAYVNPLGGDAMLAAAAARLKQEEFVGLIANSSVQGRYLDSAQADEFFAMAQEYRAPIMLHPPSAGRKRRPA